MSLSSSSKHKYTLSSADLKIYVREISDSLAKKRSLTVRTWSSVKDVKDALSQLLHVPSSAIRLYYGSNTLTSASLGRELPNRRTLADAGLQKNGETILYEVGSPSSPLASVNDVCITPSLVDLAPKSLIKIIQHAKRGFARGIKPELVMDGTGGTYFLHDARKVKVAVFKPEDEEPYACNNPRGYVSSSPAFTSSSRHNDSWDVEPLPESTMRAGIKPGDACLREVAAFLLDHDGFSGVPATTLAEARHPNFHLNGNLLKVIEGGASIGIHSLRSSKESLTDFSPISLRSSKPELPKKVGSFQEYITAECTMDDISPSKISIDEVHKIAILDIRLLNADRNAANLLVVRKFNNESGHEELILVPIDHGYCLRAVADVAWFDWCWLDWSQLKQPMSVKTKDYVLSIDVEADIRLLRDRLHLPQSALDYYRASTKLLQEGVKAGMTLYDIAILCCRNDDSGTLPSKLERLARMASEIAMSALHNTELDYAVPSKAIPVSMLNRRQSYDCIFRPLGNSSSMTRSMLSLNLASSNGQKIEPSFPDSRTASTDSSVPTPMAPSSNSGSSSFSESGSNSDDYERGPNPLTSLTADGPSLLEIGGMFQNPTDEADRFNDDESYNLSTSPIGFWTIPPSSRKAASSTTKEVEWSPHSSPMLKPLTLPLPDMLQKQHTLSPRSRSNVGTAAQDDDMDSNSLLGEYKIKFVDLLITRLTATESARHAKVKQLDRTSPFPTNKPERSPSIHQDGFSWN